MTLWGSQATVIVTALSIYQTSYGGSPTLNKTIQYIMEFTLNMQVIITVVYWSVLHEWLMNIIADKPILIFINIWIHILPFVVMAINVGLSKIRFKYERWTVTGVTSCVFMVFNFAGVKILGEPLYPFLTWNDFQSIINAVALFAFVIASYFFTTFLVNKLTLYPIS